MVSIHEVLQVDLTGQACTSLTPTRIQSGIGGMVDFMRGGASVRQRQIHIGAGQHQRERDGVQHRAGHDRGFGGRGQPGGRAVCRDRIRFGQPSSQKHPRPGGGAYRDRPSPVPGGVVQPRPHARAFVLRRPHQPLPAGDLSAAPGPNPSRWTAHRFFFGRPRPRTCRPFRIFSIASTTGTCTSGFLRSMKAFPRQEMAAMANIDYHNRMTVLALKGEMGFEAGGGHRPIPSGRARHGGGGHRGGRGVPAQGNRPPAHEKRVRHRQMQGIQGGGRICGPRQPHHPEAD